MPVPADPTDLLDRFHTPALDLTPSDRSLEFRAKLMDFMRERIFPAEAAYEQHRRANGFTDHSSSMSRPSVPPCPSSH